MIEDILYRTFHQQMTKYNLHMFDKLHHLQLIFHQLHKVCILYYNMQTLENILYISLTFPHQFHILNNHKDIHMKFVLLYHLLSFLLDKKYIELILMLKYLCFRDILYIKMFHLVNCVS